MKPATVNRVLVVIAQALREGWQPTYFDLMCEVGCHPWTVARSLNELERVGVLRVHRSRGRRNEYHIVRQA